MTATLYAGGRWQEGDATPHDVVNPATERTVYHDFGEGSRP
jgi:hypothetical protein